MATKLSAEEQVIDALHRIEPLGISFCAVCVMMSKLQPENKGYRQLEIVSKLFEPLLNHAQARLFLLTNNDFLLLTANPILDVIDDILYQIRSLFSDDFFISAQNAEDFQQIFFLPKDKESLLKFLQPKEPVEKKEKNFSHFLPVASSAVELTPEILENLLYQIEQNNTKDFIRRQSIISISKQQNTEFGQEFYTSLAELQNAFAPNLNLTGDKALFTMLMDSLDKRMLSCISDLNLKSYPPIISLNLNVQSVFLPLFDKVLSTLPCNLMVEFQISDVLHNLPLFRKACDKLKNMEIACALDGIGINELEFIPLSAFGVDCYKFFWTPKWQDNNLLPEFIRLNSQKKIILSRCGTEQAFTYGRKIGINLFQGHFIDMLLAAVRKNACTFGQECPLNDCRLRRSIACGSLRKSCVHEAHLDAFIALKGSFE